MPVVPKARPPRGTYTSLVATQEGLSVKYGSLAVETGTFRWYNKTGNSRTIIGVYSAVGTAPTGATLICDVHKDGTTIFTTQANRPTIAASGFVSDLETPDVTAWADGSYLTFDVDQVGSTVAGSDLVITVLWQEA